MRTDTAAATVARQIKALREIRGISQSELAELMGTGQAAVSRMESPKGLNLTLETLESAAAALNARLVLELQA